MKEIRFTPKTPRSMTRVMSDIDYCITNDVDCGSVMHDINQLIAQLNSLKGSLGKKDSSYKILNPASAPNYLQTV